MTLLEQPQASTVAAYTQAQDIEANREALKRAEFLVDAIAASLVPGMKESEARKMARQVFEENGHPVSWHRPYIHFGSNTLMTFKDKRGEDLRLQPEDIAFMDIGPVIGEIEADYGRTVVFGENPLYLDLQRQCERLFEMGVTYWREHQPTGEALYAYIRAETEALGYRFNLDPAGHLIGRHPHLGWKKGLDHYPYVPQAGMWILEIQIRHPEQPYGAFYESLLI